MTSVIRLSVTKGSVPVTVITFANLVNASGWMIWALDGWRLSGITEIHEGRPITITQSGDSNNDGVYGDRPNRIGSGRLSSSDRSIDQIHQGVSFVSQS